MGKGDTHAGITNFTSKVRTSSFCQQKRAQSKEQNKMIVLEIVISGRRRYSQYSYSSQWASGIDSIVSIPVVWEKFREDQWLEILAC